MNWIVFHKDDAHEDRETHDELTTLDGARELAIAILHRDLPKDELEAGTHAPLIDAAGTLPPEGGEIALPDGSKIVVTPIDE